MTGLLDKIDEFAVEMVDDAVGHLQARFGASYAVIQMTAVAVAGVISMLAMSSAFLAIDQYSFLVGGAAAYIVMFIVVGNHFKEFIGLIGGIYRSKHLKLIGACPNLIAVHLGVGKLSWVLAL